MKFRWVLNGFVYGLSVVVAVYTIVQHLTSSARAAQAPGWRREADADAAVAPGRRVAGWFGERFGSRSFLAERDRSGEQEWMDLPGQDPRQLTEMFTDLERVNRWLGGSWMTNRALNSIAREIPQERPITILDVASGSGDIPRVMARWARRQQRDVTVIATDINPDVLRLGLDSDDTRSIHILAADAHHLPFADDAVDVVACSFFLHHLDPQDVVVALREMQRVSRGTVLINDMVRGWPSFAGAWLFSRVFTRNPISRHDAVLSARRSYSRAELLDFAAQAGLEATTSFGFAGYRVVLVARDAAPQPQTVQPLRNVAAGVPA